MLAPMEQTPRAGPTEFTGATVVLGDGESAFLRHIEPSDASALLAFHERQPSESQYRRFFSPKRTLSPDELRHFTDVDRVNRVALVLEIHGEFAAWASYERWRSRDDADVAFMVDHLHRGKGIATLLLEHLAAIARSNGISRFTAETLADNRAMIAVFSRAGWAVKRHFDSGIIDIEFPLGDTDAFIDSVEAREHRADSRAVARLLLPRTIAVIGASNVPGSVGNELWRSVSASGIAAYPVNPAHASIGDVRCVASVTDIDDDVWLAVVAVPAAALARTIDECITKRVRGAVVVTAVDETRDGIDLDAIVEHARRNGLRIVGPASMGIASAPFGDAPALQASLAQGDLRPGVVAISMQSGTLGSSVLQLAQQLDVGLSWFVSLGDKRDISGNDLLQFWEDDERTRVIAMYTESFGNPRKFARIATRVARTRPIVTVRTGAASVGPGGDALYQQAGLIEVPTVLAMLDTVRVLATQPVPHGNRVAVLTNSRSPGVLAAAALRNAGLDAVAPPIGLDWRSTPADVAAALRAALADDGVDAVLVVHAPPVASAPPPSASISEAARGATKPVLAVLLGQPDGPIAAGSPVPSFAFPEPAAAVLGRMYAYAHWLHTEALDAPAPLADTSAEQAHHIIVEALGSAARHDCAQHTTTQLLATYSITMAPTVAVSAADTTRLTAAADELGWPVVLKANHRRFGHSAASGVALDLGDATALGEAYTVMRAALGADADDVVVQRMVAPGADVRIKVTLAAQLGVVVSVGLGGMAADVIGDSANRLAPLSVAGAVELIERSRVAGALNAAHCPVDDVADVIRRVGQLAFDHPEIVSIDINPLIASSGSCWVTDAHIVLAATDHHTDPLRKL